MRAITDPFPLRLDRLLANLGYGSRAQVTHDLIRAGLVVRDGVPCMSERDKISRSDAQRLTVAGEGIDPLFPLTIIYHKPVGEVSSHRAEGGAPSVFDSLPARWRRRDPALSIAGRLDLSSRGLMIISDDGESVHRLTAPRHHVAKHYRVRLRDPLRGDETALFASGAYRLNGEDKPLLPAHWNPSGPCEGTMILHEGRNRQIRRMFDQLGNDVVDLMRFRMGDVVLPDDLGPGGWIILGSDDWKVQTDPDRSVAGVF